MGSTAMRARGVVDIDTGAILAVTDHAVGRLGPGGRWSDLTPDHVVEAVATGGGTIAMAGEGWLTWWAAGRSVRLEVDRLARIAVRGELVAGMTDAGAALLWPAVDRGVRVDLRVDLHPEGVAVTPDRRVVIWGLTPDGRARLVVLDPDTGAEVEPPASWPSRSPTCRSDSTTA